MFIQPVFGVKMENKDKRRSILVEEAQFEAFDERCKALGMNSSETLDVLLQQEVERTTTLKVEKGQTMSNIINQMAKKGDD